MKQMKRCLIISLLLSLLISSLTVWADQEAQTSLHGFDQTTESDSDKTMIQTNLMIDSQNRYEGMNQTYAQGYIPTIENGFVYLIMPIISSGMIKDNSLRVSLNLGDTESSPFVFKNYEKCIQLDKSWVNDGLNLTESYVAEFWLELKTECYNGSYPVIMSVSGADEKGNELSQDFTVYVTIMDGKDKSSEAAGGDSSQPVTFMPKIVIQSCQFSKDNICAGDDVTVDITLLNTSKTEDIQNMTVKVNPASEFLTLFEQSDTHYVESVTANGTCALSCHFQVNAAAPSGQYDLELEMQYADSKASDCSSSGKVRIRAEQPTKLEFDGLEMPEQVEIADIVTASVQAMNLGKSKVYNVRAVMEADGLSPQGTIFIGDLEAGTMGSANTQVSVSSLSKSASLYGKTEGVVTFYYEDENGQEHSENMTFITTIASPFSDEAEKKEDKPEQWWSVMAVIICILIILAALIFAWRLRRRKENAVLEKVFET